MEFTQPNKLLRTICAQSPIFACTKKKNTCTQLVPHVTRQAANFNDVILKSVFHPCVVAESATDSQLTLINGPSLRTNDCRNIYMFLKVAHRNIPLSL